VDQAWQLVVLFRYHSVLIGEQNTCVQLSSPAHDVFIIDKALCISRIMSSLLTPMLLPAGSFCIIIPVLHDYCLCNLLGAVIPHLIGRNCSRLGPSLSSVSLGTHNGYTHPNTTGSEEVTCGAPRYGQNADNCNIVRFEVFTAMTMKNIVFWDMAPCGSGSNRRFGGTYRLHLQDR
jgi:hypothetical protein